MYEGVGTGTPLDTFAYSNAGVLGSATEPGTGNSSTYSHDGLDRLTSLAHAFAGGTGNVISTLSYSPASQLTGEARDNDAYAFSGLVTVNRNYAVNGLNQYSTAGTASFTYDANGNLTSDGSNSYIYDPENRLVSVTGARTANLAYDPLGRLQQIDNGAGTTTKFVYDGDGPGAPPRAHYQKLIARPQNSGCESPRLCNHAGAESSEFREWGRGLRGVGNLKICGAGNPRRQRDRRARDRDDHLQL